MITTPYTAGHDAKRAHVKASTCSTVKSTIVKLQFLVRVHLLQACNASNLILQDLQANVLKAWVKRAVVQVILPNMSWSSIIEFNTLVSTKYLQASGQIYTNCVGISKAKPKRPDIASRYTRTVSSTGICDTQS